MLARKSVKQSYTPSQRVLDLIKEFRQMTNESIRIGLANDASSLKRLSNLSYKELKRYNVRSCYKLCAISKAAGILASRKKSINRGFETKDPYLKKLVLVSCYSFKIVNEKLRIPLGNRKFEEIQLVKHTLKVLSDKSLKVNSFTITESSLSLCISKEVQELIPLNAVGIDRNLRNLAVGNRSKVIYYDMNKVIKIGETTKDIVRSFKRNDVRIRREISSKYGMGKKNRVQNILNKISKDIVHSALENKQAIVFEDIKYIRSMYRKGNYQSKAYRRLMNNNWPFYKIKRQVEYKANWLGIPVIHLTKKETRGTSLECPSCGERLQKAFKNEVQRKRRDLWCSKCKRWLDRDLVATMNISYRGWLRFSQSKGTGSEAMVQEPSKEVAILQVDPVKLGQGGEKSL
ncbi:MAG: IS200/IS605 family accessory protein TnpB-related protein [Nitrososphaerales archaeon]